MKTETKQDFYDVIAVNIEDSSISMMGEGKTMPNAEAIEKMAIMRRGVDECFYVIVPAGQYKGGDTYKQ